MDLSLEGMAKRLYHRNREAMLAGLQSDGRVRSGSLLAVLAFLLALVPCCVSAALVAFSIHTLLHSESLLLTSILVLPLLLLGVLGLPRPVFVAKEHVVLKRGDHADLFRLLDDLSEKLGRARIHQIVIDTRWNASFWLSGLSMRRTLSIGLPMLSVLDSRAVHAVICHELAHANLSHPALDAWIQASLRSMDHWKTMVYDAMQQIKQGPEVLLKPLGWALIFLFQGYQYGILCLDWLQSQRAEFKADSHALRATSQEDLMQALRRLPYEEVVEECLQESLLQRADFLVLLKDAAPRKLAGRLFANESRLDADEAGAQRTHPSLRDRIRMLAHQPTGVRANTDFVEELRRRVEPHEETLARKMVEAYGETCS